MIEWIKTNWDTILEVIGVVYIVAELVVKLTPSEKDNTILKKVVDLVNQVIDLIVPNLKKGGGTHNTNIIVKKK